MLFLPTLITAYTPLDVDSDLDTEVVDYKEDQGATASSSKQTYLNASERWRRAILKDSFDRLREELELEPHATYKMILYVAVHQIKLLTQDDTRLEAEKERLEAEKKKLRKDVENQG
ncbi:hypothetical protein GZ77_06910 [Endozoicomonas montiporae]|uniref:BHLH domain-containing protein n=2 Tax=Endozoicomonas montiporae TaxID=1027273 RepID=A0A081N6U7_9GAMM|nr:hypothetical protein [Endozoicomonas montiporae]AMO56511.1 hypothetical protein EZMO1_2416 [Endozoicomonas montiporae CL-33]KEQ14170.1 hypothetical protein GZ77_06910 [Endozoicomonas montiporae]